MNIVDIVNMYRGGASTYEIANSFGTYPNKIRRMLEKNGEVLRDKSSAQITALESGRSAHPTKGKQRTEEEKIAISTSAVKHWENMGGDEKERRRAQSKELWDSISPEKKEKMREKAAQEIRKAAKDGSKLEKKIQEILTRAGYKYESHKKDLIPTQKLELDLFIPALKTIIEVDGLSHFEPIWGEDQLKKQIEFDTQKDGIILSRGFRIIRIENFNSSMAIARLLKLEQELLQVLEDIKNGTLDTNLKVIKYE
jgi:very-short-patch-repair endonuclease